MKSVNFAKFQMQASDAAPVPEEESLIVAGDQPPPQPQQVPEPRQRQQRGLVQSFADGIMTACCILSIIALFDSMFDKDPTIIQCRFSCVRVYSDCPSGDYNCPSIYQDRCYDEYEEKPMDNTLGKISCEHPPTPYARKLQALVVWGWVILLSIVTLGTLVMLLYKGYQRFYSAMDYN